MNGGEKWFKLKQFEVYSVSVTININIIYRNNERRVIVRLTKRLIYNLIYTA